MTFKLATHSLLPPLGLACCSGDDDQSLVVFTPRMKQLPGGGRPLLLKQLISFAALLIATVWMVTLLPALLVIGLIAALLLVPVLRQLRQEIDQLERRQRGDSPPPLDVTPWHRRVWNRWHRR